MQTSTIDADKLARQAVEKWGVEARLDKAAEEALELAHAILKLKQGRCEPEDVVEEMVDMEVMFGSLRVVFAGIDEGEIRNRKLKRLWEKVHEPW